MKKWNGSSPRPVEAIKGACLIVRRAALEAGEPLLDERYFMYTEEVDLCYRLAQAGWDLYWIPLARVTHLGRSQQPAGLQRHVCAALPQQSAVLSQVWRRAARSSFQAPGDNRLSTSPCGCAHRIHY